MIKKHSNLFYVLLFAHCLYADTVIDLSLISQFPYVIDQSGDYKILASYTFEDTIALAIHITADDVRLEGNVSLIDGNNKLDTFIKIDSANNVEIKRIKVISTNAQSFIVDSSSVVSFLEITGITTAQTPLMSVVDSTLVQLIIGQLSGNGSANLSCLRSNDLRISSISFSGETGYVADYGCLFDECTKVVCESCTSNFNQNGFLIKNSSDVFLRMCGANASVQNGFVCNNDGATSEMLTFAGCQAQFNGINGFVLNGTNILVQHCQARLNEVDGFSIQQANGVTLEECATVKNKNCGIVVSENAQNVSIVDLHQANDVVGAVENHCSSLNMCSLENIHCNVKDCLGKVDCVLGSKLETLANLSEFDQENLSVSVSDYASTTALTGKQLTSIGWEKALYDRLLRLEFKINQILNATVGA